MLGRACEASEGFPLCRKDSHGKDSHRKDSHSKTLCALLVLNWKTLILYGFAPKFSCLSFLV